MGGDDVKGHKFKNNKQNFKTIIESSLILLNTLIFKLRYSHVDIPAPTMQRMFLPVRIQRKFPLKSITTALL